MARALICNIGKLVLGNFFYFTDKTLLSLNFYKDCNYNNANSLKFKNFLIIAINSFKEFCHTLLAINFKLTEVLIHDYK